MPRPCGEHDPGFVRRAQPGMPPPLAPIPLRFIIVTSHFLMDPVNETGGENHEDQFDRLRFLTRELQQSNAGYRGAVLV